MTVDSHFDCDKTVRLRETVVASRMKEHCFGRHDEAAATQVALKERNAI